MKVILNQSVPKVGKEGQIVNVADGFARNFLFPRGLAVLAEKNQVAALERRAERLKAKTAEALSGAQSQKEKIDGTVLRVEGNVGKDTGKLFGAVTAQDVADLLKAQTGVEVDKKNIALVQPIKRLGDFPVQVDLHPEVEATITVQVYDPNAPVVTEAPAEEAPAEEEAEEVTA